MGWYPVEMSHLFVMFLPFVCKEPQGDVWWRVGSPSVLSANPLLRLMRIKVQKGIFTHIFNDVRILHEYNHPYVSPLKACRTDPRCENTSQPGAAPLTSLRQRSPTSSHSRNVSLKFNPHPQMSFGGNSFFFFFLFPIKKKRGPLSTWAVVGGSNPSFHVSQHISRRTVLSVWQSH